MQDTEKIQPVKDLLIIGNGFDLEAKLKTSYADFLEIKCGKLFDEDKIDDQEYAKLNVLKNLSKEISKRLKNYDYGQAVSTINPYITAQSLDELMTKINDKKMSVWEILLIFKSNSTENWYDVESLIENIVNTSHSFIADVTNFYNYKIGKVNELGHSSDEAFLIFSYWASSTGKIGTKITKLSMLYDSEILEWLNEQLTLFQERFKEYMRILVPQLDENSYETVTADYAEQAFKIFANVSGEFEGTEINLLNFNYTQPNLYRHLVSNAIAKASPQKIYSKNVHGKISDKDNPIIFGIDNANIDPNKTEVNFTKAFRTLSESSAKRFGEIDNSQVKNIVFFGHSLGRADYGYFYKVFNDVDLLNSRDVNLIFYYNDSYIKDDANIELWKKKKEKVVYTQKLAILRLLESYAEWVRRDRLRAKTVLSELQSQIKIVKYNSH
ncbi:hypothetical protein WOSG25_110500 [Weissella oryzae SG25]|uniref:Bacteriophage abortive infection AbiH n=1 Tax=Weissella oryzae (strain DSM 25784 / JCM 18191 / LMG 30913 / SG25) TaxID=1329250 RepID=A0A069CW04_WEIOS|nr:AbiH family protein [Weissella oryzae]GAK31572.1 hypothetical protein WOSG25_110500 [Weissella oryzae SG25]